MTGVSFGEILIIVVLMLISIDVKKIGSILRKFRDYKNKFNRVHLDLKSQVNSLIEDEENKELLEKSIHSKAALRKWATLQVHKLSSAEKYNASLSFLSHIENLDVFNNAGIVATYYSQYDEMDTSYLNKKILESGKTLAFPFVIENSLSFARVQNMENDMHPGAFGIFEPTDQLKNTAEVVPDLIIVPGRCFDKVGGRVGRGKGFYDKYLASFKGSKIGLCFENQISFKKIDFDDFDIPMDFILTEKEIINITADKSIES